MTNIPVPKISHNKVSLANTEERHSESQFLDTERGDGEGREKRRKERKKGKGRPEEYTC